MTKISTHNQSLLFLFILTIIASALAYRIMVRAYNALLTNSALEFELAE